MRTNLPVTQNEIQLRDDTMIVSKTDIKGRITYINRDWFAMEQSFYVNWGNGRDVWSELFVSTPVYGVGSGIYCNIPMIPWLAFRVFFTYSGKNSNWFNLDI